MIEFILQQLAIRGHTYLNLLWQKAGKSVAHEKSSAEMALRCDVILVGHPVNSQKIDI